MPRVSGDFMLVGSVPGDSSEEVLRKLGVGFGDVAFALPDGETGDRANWAVFEVLRLFRVHPDVEILQEQITLPGAPEWVPVNMWGAYGFRYREGVEHVTYDHLPRTDLAIESYRIFRSLVDEGVIPEGVRFQVCLPFPASAAGWCFRDNFEHDYPIHERAWEEAFARELARMLEVIPAEHLALQWDICFEVLDLERLFPFTNVDGAWERFAGPARRISREIPQEVLLGGHFCYGTFPEWPMREAEDMSLIVRMANAFVETSGRTVDWLHLAGPRHLRSLEYDFYRPLQELRPGDARVFLGLIQPWDGITGLLMRAQTARRYLPDFGVAMYCGFGRQPGDDAAGTLLTHRETLEAFLAAREGSSMAA